jgi:hypothetical protein
MVSQRDGPVNRRVRRDVTKPIRNRELIVNFGRCECHIVNHNLRSVRAQPSTILTVIRCSAAASQTELFVLGKNFSPRKPLTQVRQQAQAGFDDLMGILLPQPQPSCSNLSLLVQFHVPVGVADELRPALHANRVLRVDGIPIRSHRGFAQSQTGGRRPIGLFVLQATHAKTLFSHVD